jgi:hypothetical protein
VVSRGKASCRRLVEFFEKTEMSNCFQVDMPPGRVGQGTATRGGLLLHGIEHD